MRRGAKAPAALLRSLLVRSDYGLGDRRDVLLVNSMRIVIAAVILFCGTVGGQGLLRTLDAFCEDFTGVVPLVPKVDKERITFSCFKAREGLLAKYNVRYSFRKARLERDMPCVAIIVDMPSVDDRAKAQMRQALVAHGLEVWGAGVVERGGFGVPGKSTVEYGRKSAKAPCFLIVEEELKRPGLSDLTRFTIEAKTYKALQYNKARIQ